MKRSDTKLLINGKALQVRTWQPEEAPKDNAPTLFLFHDSLGCIDLWRDLPERLVESTGLSVVAYDRLGFGSSDPNPETLRCDFISQEVQLVVSEVIRALSLGRLIPLGHSVGGAMAIETAFRYPDLCEAVIAISAQTCVEEQTLVGIREAKKAFSAPQQMERLARYHGSKAPWVLASWIETWLADDFRSWTLEPALKSLKCPLLAIYGEDDEYCSAVHPNRIRTLSTGRTTVKTLEGCGHLPHRERPEEVMALIADFGVQWRPGEGSVTPPTL